MKCHKMYYLVEDFTKKIHLFYGTLVSKKKKYRLFVDLNVKRISIYYIVHGIS